MLDLNVNINSLRNYLIFNDWKKVNTNYKGLDAFINPIESSSFLILPNSDDIKNNELENYVNQAIKKLSAVNEETVEQVKINIEFLVYDQHSFRLQTERNSIPLKLFESLILSTKNTILKNLSELYTRTNFSTTNWKKRKIKSKNELINDFLEGINFPHTWRGSFGVSLNTPLQTEGISIFNNSQDKETLSRKASISFADTFKILTESVEKGSTDYVLEGIGDTKILKAYLPFNEVLKHIKKNQFEYKLDLSPTVKGESYQRYNKSKALINESTLSNLSRALEQVQKDEIESFDIDFFGFPKMLKSDKKTILDETSEGTREISVKGQSQKIGDRTLRFNLSYEDYKKATHAHDEGLNIRINCEVKPSGRTFEIIKIHSVDILE